ncbi:MAG: hypothetical protein EZS28_044498, partial [Streblomastix strix]
MTHSQEDNFKVLNTDPATSENQNNFAGFIGTRSYPISTQIAQAPLVHFLWDSIVRIMFDDAPEPQILNLEVIGEIGGSIIVAVFKPNKWVRAKPRAFVITPFIWIQVKCGPDRSKFYCI